MKLTFEGQSLYEIFDQMRLTLQADYHVAKVVKAPVSTPFEISRVAAQEVKPPIVEKPVDKPVEKRARTEKQLANDEKMRVAALERVAARRAAKAERPSETVKKLAEKFVEELAEDLRPDPIGKEPEEVDPAEMVKIRQKTIEELQAAYANGHQAEVFELLSRFGNGAKSFRELPPESFMPIRRAIDLGALE